MKFEPVWIRRPWVSVTVLVLLYVAAGCALISSYFYAWRSSLPGTPRASWDYLQTLSAVFGWSGIAMLLLAIIGSVIFGFRGKTRRRNVIE